MAFVTTTVDGYKLSVEYGDRVVRIKNNKALDDLLKNNFMAAHAVAKKVKSEYNSKKGKALNIEGDSLAIEILGHVYPDRIASAIKKLPLPGWIEKQIDKVLKRTEVIDCGESAVDSNRGFWDFLGGLVNIDNL